MFPTRAAGGSIRPSRALVRATLVWLGLLALAPGATAQDVSVSVRSRGNQPGDALALTITTPPDTREVTIAAFSASWPAYRVNERTWEALLGIDLDRKPGPYEVVVSSTGASTSTARRTVTVVPKRFPRRLLKVAPAFVNPPKDQLARIAKDSEFLSAVYATVSDVPMWLNGLQRPVSEVANSSFGSRSVYNGEARSPHAGTDFLSPSGTPIHAPAAGRVLGARNLYFTGDTVIIDHGLGVFSMLAHLSRIDVREGQSVAPGDVVGLVGATGRVTGPHLHWALRVGAARVDPLSALTLFEPPK
ncbi:MAG: M23 family metallopeptidase [Vicinamibacterales bacterium]